MKIPLFGLILAIASANEDICRSCNCKNVNVLLHQTDPGSDLDWSPLSILPNTNGKYLSVSCSRGRIGSKLPPILIDGLIIHAGRNYLEKFPEFPEKTRMKIMELSLSGNIISKIRVYDTDGYQNLKILDVSSNGISSVEEFAFSKLTNLLKLDLSGNEITTVERWWSKDVVLRHLNLADNGITQLGPESFPSLRDLIFLDLSNNFLSALPNNFASSLTSLRYLQLMENKFEVIPRLPRSLFSLNATSNALRTLVLPQIDDLGILDVSHNDLDDLDNVYDQLALKILRVSHNRLSGFGSWKGTELKILDLRDNHFRVIPAEINPDRLPQLQKLYLDGNPLNEISFTRGSKSFVNLDLLGLSRLGNITKMDREVFKGILLEMYINCSEESGIFVNLSHNQLKTIDADTFKNFPVCSVDLSNNCLTAIAEDLLPWQYLMSVDLQNNPWNCICELQWMLDKYIPHFYVKNPRNLLELRCATPSHFKHRMFVYWYNSTKQIFCQGPSYYQFEYSEGKYFEMWTANMIICAVLGCLIIIILTAILIIQFWKPKPRNVRRKQKMSRPLFREIRINPDHKYNEIPQERAPE